MEDLHKLWISLFMFLIIGAIMEIWKYQFGIFFFFIIIAYFIVTMLILEPYWFKDITEQQLEEKENE